MIKKGLFAIALMAILSVTVQAGDLSYDGFIKFDDQTPNAVHTDTWWPVEYLALDICQLPIYMEIGMYAELVDCMKTERDGTRSLKIVLKQVQCDTISQREFPCYRGCRKFKIRTNFKTELGTVLYRRNMNPTDPQHPQYVIDTDRGRDKWKAILSQDVLDPGETEVEICIEAWSADIFYAEYGTMVQVGEVAITVKPLI